MKTKRVLKKGVREKFIIIILILVAIYAGYRVIKSYNSVNHKLGKIGYTIDEINKIKELDKVDLFLTHDYHSKLLDVVTSKYYLEKNLDTYLSYYDNNNDKNINDIIAIVNVGADNEFYTNVKETNINDGFAILVNKYYKLNEEYKPDNLVDVSNWYSYGEQKVNEEVYTQFKKMFNDASNEGLTLIINDSYRTYEEQENNQIKYGDELAARAGHSEHNTGLAIDITSYDYDGSNFDQSDEFKWLSTNAHKYGFILRYPKGKEYLTGYDYESWHYRYLGKDLATKVYESGLTYDEYYAYYLEK